MKLSDILQYTSRAFLDMHLPVSEANGAGGRRMVLVGKEGRMYRCSAYDWTGDGTNDPNALEAEELWESVMPTRSETKFFGKPEEIEAYYKNSTDWEGDAPFDPTPFGS